MPCIIAPFSSAPRPVQRPSTPATVHFQTVMAVTAPHQPPPPVQDGVIEEARRRQHRRRLRGLAAVALAVAVAAFAWMLGGASSKASPRSHRAGGALAIDASVVRQPGFNVRLYPSTRVGEAGWCEQLEEHGALVGGGPCGAVPTTAVPFTMIYGFSDGNSTYSTTIAVTIPEVASIIVNGVRRVTPVLVPGLPYGLRAARIVTAKSEPLTPAMRRAVRREGTVLVAFNAQGRRLPKGPIFASHRQARVLSWRYPHPPARGTCRLAVKGMPELIARGGRVAADIRPFPGHLVGQAFLPCAETVYGLHGVPVRALIMLNAADPSAAAGELPNFNPAPHAPGFLAQGSLTAARDGSFWLMVGHGASRAQDIEVLRHLTASVRL